MRDVERGIGNCPVSRQTHDFCRIGLSEWSENQSHGFESRDLFHIPSANVCLGRQRLLLFGEGGTDAISRGNPLANGPESDSS